MESKPKRIKGIEYPSSLSLVLRKREYIVDPEGYYKILGIDPNEKNWGKQEIKDRFRAIIKVKGHDKKLIEAYKTLTSTQRVVYDSLTKSLERLIEEVSTGKKKMTTDIQEEKEISFAYYVSEDHDENYNLAKEWMAHLATYYHRSGREQSAKVVLSDHFEKAIYPWGELVYVDTNYKPDLDVLAYHLLKDTKDNWYLDYCKIIRKWE